MKEIRSLRVDMRRVEKDNLQLTEKINQREREMQQLLAENDILREKAGVPKDWGIHAEQLDLQFQLDLQKAKTDVLHHQQVIQHLEKER